MSQDGEAILASVFRGPLLAHLAISPASVARMRGGDSPLHFSENGKVALTVGLEGSLRLGTLRPSSREARRSGLPDRSWPSVAMAKWSQPAGRATG